MWASLPPFVPRKVAHPSLARCFSSAKSPTPLSIIAVVFPSNPTLRYSACISARVHCTANPAHSTDPWSDGCDTPCILIFKHGAVSLPAYAKYGKRSIYLQIRPIYWNDKNWLLCFHVRMIDRLPFNLLGLMCEIGLLYPVIKILHQWKLEAKRHLTGSRPSIFAYKNKYGPIRQKCFDLDT